MLHCKQPSNSDKPCSCWLGRPELVSNVTRIWTSLAELQLLLLILQKAPMPMNAATHRIENRKLRRFNRNYSTWTYSCQFEIHRPRRTGKRAPNLTILLKRNFIFFSSTLITLRKNSEILHRMHGQTFIRTTRKQAQIQNPRDEESYWKQFVLFPGSNITIGHLHIFIKNAAVVYIDQRFPWVWSLPAQWVEIFRISPLPSPTWSHHYWIKKWLP